MTPHDDNNYNDDLHILNSQIVDNLQRYNDPVQRNVITGDWDSKKSVKTKNQRLSLIVFLIFVLLMVGAIVTFVYAEQPSTSQQYEQLLNEETRQKYDNMHQQMDDIIQKREASNQRWRMLIAIAAIISLLPAARVVKDAVRGRIPVRSAKGAFQGAAIIIAGSLALFAINLGFFYFSYEVELQIRLAILSLLTIIGVIALLIWYFKRGIHS